MERLNGDGRQRLRTALLASAQALGVAVSERETAQLLDFLALMSRWNRTYNLTAIRDPASMLSHHIVDSLAVVEPLRRQRSLVPATTLLDVGSGGGLPGVVLAVMEPALAVTCIDAVGKKAAFIRQAAASLGTANLTAEHARVEAFRGRVFDVVVSRAFASLRDFVQSTRHLLSGGGVWMAMKGKLPEAEIAALASDIDVFHVEPLPVPDDVGERCLVWMREQQPDQRLQLAADK